MNINIRSQQVNTLKVIKNIRAISIPAGIYLLKVDNRNTRRRCSICTKLTTKTSERRQWRRCGVFFVSFEHIQHLVLVFLFLTLNMWLPVGMQQSIGRFFANPLTIYPKKVHRRCLAMVHIISLNCLYFHFWTNVSFPWVATTYIVLISFSFT